MDGRSGTGAQFHKPREARRRVLIPARMKQGMNWTDVCIHNVSPHGLLLRGRLPPSPGSYVEFRRGCHIIIARVIWVNEQDFGAKTQDVLPIDQIIREPNREASPAIGNSDVNRVERRGLPHTRSVVRSHEASRRRSSAIQFCFMIVVGGSFAAAVGAAVWDALTGPLAVAISHL